MPIISGSGTGAGATTLICSSVLVGTQANFDTNTILGANIPATFNHLRVVAYLRSDLAAQVNDQTMLRFNNDSSTNYDYQGVHGIAAAATAFEVFALASGKIGTHPAVNASASLFSTHVVDIPLYLGTTGNKDWAATFFAKWGTATGNLETGTLGGSWRSSVAITRVQVLPLAASNFVAGSAFYLYGVT